MKLLLHLNSLILGVPLCEAPFLQPCNFEFFNLANWNFYDFLTPKIDELQLGALDQSPAAAALLEKLVKSWRKRMDCQ